MSDGEDVSAPAIDAPVPGRECGDCGLCCKLLAITELSKPENRWCGYFKAGKGCSTYAERPSSCRTFFCGWRRAANLGDEWRPNRARMMLYTDEKGSRLFVHVDPGFPGAWLEQPYYAQLKRWSSAVKDGRQVIVRIRDRMIVILPNRDIDLGVVASGDTVRTFQVMTVRGVEYSAEKIAKTAETSPDAAAAASAPTA